MAKDKAAREKTKTNAMRQLDSAGISYRTMEYEVDESDLSGVHVAAQLGQPCEQIFKTLVLKDEKGEHYVCCIPVDQELDLKKVAKACKTKKVEMLPMKELLPTTGYIRGGCSPIGMKKTFHTTVQESARNVDTIFFSGGKVGYQVEVAPQDLEKMVRLEYGDVICG